MCIVHESLQLVVGACSKTRSFRICTPAQLSCLFRSDSSDGNHQPSQSKEKDRKLPVLWLKVKVEEVQEVQDELSVHNVDRMPPFRLLMFRPADLPLTIRDLRPGESQQNSLKLLFLYPQYLPVGAY